MVAPTLRRSAVAGLALTVAGVLAASAQGRTRNRERPQSSGRPQSPALTCTQAAGLVRSRGALVLGTGGDTDDPYVSGQGGCQTGELAEAAFVPTRDTPHCFAGYRCRARTSRSSGSN